jgi:hypothetical protein
MGAVRMSSPGIVLTRGRNVGCMVASRSGGCTDAVRTPGLGMRVTGRSDGGNDVGRTASFGTGGSDTFCATGLGR